MDNKVLFSSGDYRILEVEDTCISMDDLKGDCFNATVNSDIDATILKREELGFETKVINKGVFGYILEKWNPNIDKGWMHVDSCFGFVGTFEDEKHYIVDELKSLI